jgi:hypothetical protein
MDSDANLPKKVNDPENLQRLREEARRRLDREPMPMPRPVYGGPPPPSRRWTLIGITVAVAALVAALVSWFLGRKPIAPVAVYGGPPPREPRP